MASPSFSSRVQPIKLETTNIVVPKKEAGSKEGSRRTLIRGSLLFPLHPCDLGLFSLMKQVRKEKGKERMGSGDALRIGFLSPLLPPLSESPAVAKTVFSLLGRLFFAEKWRTEFKTIDWNGMSSKKRGKNGLPPP